MLSTEIESKLKNIRNFIGVFSRDTLPGTPVNLYPHSLVANTDTKDKSGTHWICFFFDENGHGTYFDSYALGPFCREFESYLRINSKTGYSWNKVPLQCDTCVSCGQYCCAYIILRTAGISHMNFMRLFSNDTYANDHIIKSIFQTLK